MKIFRKILTSICLLLIIQYTGAQSISFTSTFPRLVYSSSSVTIRTIISGDVNGAAVGSVKLKFKHIKDSTRYYANMDPVTYTIIFPRNPSDITLLLNPSRISNSRGTVVNPIILYATLTQNDYTNFFDTSKGFRKGQYDVTAEYVRASNGVTITSAIMRFSLQHITLPPKITSPASGTTTKGKILFKDIIYDSTVLTGTKLLNIYKNSDRSLMSTITLSDSLSDSLHINLLDIASSSGIISATGTNTLPSDTYRLVLSYRDRSEHDAAADSTVITLKTATQPPILYTAKNTVFNAKNPNGPISYLLPDTASSANLVLKNVSNGTAPLITIPLPTTSGQRQNYSIDPALQIADGQYEIKLGYKDYLDNDEASVTDTVFFQRTTALPVITQPVNWQTVSSPLIIKDSVTGSVLPGSKTMLIAGTSKAGVTINITLQLSDAQKDSVYYDAVNLPTANGTVVTMTHSNAGSTALPDGDYAITVSYRDTFGNQLTTSAPVNFKLKTATNTPIISSKVTATPQGNAVNFTFTLPDLPLANSTVLVLRNSTRTDSLFLQPQPTTATQSFTWLSNTNPTTISGAPVLAANPALANGIADGSYAVLLSYKDQLGNAAAMATGDSIFIRNNKPSITASGSLSVCYGDTVTLTSSAAFGNKWYLNNTALDTTASLVARTAGVYKLASVFDNYASFVDSVFVTQKQLPNAPATQHISYYAQDTINTALTAEAITGNTLRWYGTDSTGGTVSLTAPIPRTAVVGTYNYYVSQLNNTSGCESSRAKLAVTIVPLPPGVDKNGKVGSKEALQKNGKVVEVIKTGN
jgi:hypothetical protein